MTSLSNVCAIPFSFPLPTLYASSRDPVKRPCWTTPKSRRQYPASTTTSSTLSQSIRSSLATKSTSATHHEVITDAVGIYSSCTSTYFFMSCTGRQGDFAVCDCATDDYCNPNSTRHLRSVIRPQTLEGLCYNIHSHPSLQRRPMPSKDPRLPLASNPSHQVLEHVVDHRSTVTRSRDCKAEVSKRYHCCASSTNPSTTSITVRITLCRIYAGKFFIQVTMQHWQGGGGAQRYHEARAQRLKPRRLPRLVPDHDVLILNPYFPAHPNLVRRRQCSSLPCPVPLRV